MEARKLRLFIAAITFGGGSAIAQGLPGEINARQAADAALQGNINAEAVARSAADTRLQNSINDETAIRAATDAQLQNQINQLRGGGGGGTVTVDCAALQTISEGLASGADRIVVRGTCTESLSVSRDNVTLVADPAGGGIHGPDVDVNTVNVTGNRVTIDGLTVSGGRNGITGVGAANLTVRNCVVQSTGRTGISYANGSSGTVDGCTVQSNTRDGIAVDGAQATIVNSTITNNRNGVLVVNGGTSRIGITDRLAAAGNTISQNAGNGVTISQGGSAIVAMNTITENGTNPASSGRSGVSALMSATVSIAGGNTISRNPGPGIAVSVGSTAVIGDPAAGLTTVNTISRNGSAASPGGISAFLGSSIVVRDAVIEENNGLGVILTMRAQLQLLGSTIRDNVAAGNNAGDGIRLGLGSALLANFPPSTISGNAGVGLQCTDGESSTISPGANPLLSISGNFLGQVSAGCTGF